MAFKLNDYGGYGAGTNGEVTNPTGQVNSYASVTDFDSTSITIGTPSTGAYEDFTVGTQVLIHVSATNGTSTATTYLGKYMVATITAVDGSVLTIDKDFTEVISVAIATSYQIQAIAIAQFTTLTISSGSVSPIAYDVTNGYGGILAIKCSSSLEMAGGNILLDGLGIPTASTAYRPETTQETSGHDDTDDYAGWENHITVREFLLSCGCGAAFIMAAAMNVTAVTGYIGGNGGDAEYQRGDRTGGASILIAAGTVTGFDPKIIDCSYGSGAGLGRCYIASNEAVQGGFEGIFAADLISDKTRLMRKLNIKGYGDGSSGNLTNPTDPLNNYGHVTGMNAAGNIISLENVTNNNATGFSAGALVMFHVSKPRGNDVSFLGRFCFAKVVSYAEGAVTLDSSVYDYIFGDLLGSYDCQLITVPQAGNVTIGTDYNATTAWDDTLKRGGIFACVANGTVNLSGGQINVEGKGGGNTYSNNAMLLNGNTMNSERLPLGSGHGSVFILAKTLTEDADTRIGATYTGNALGGTGGNGGAGNRFDQRVGYDGNAGGAGYGGGGYGGNGYGGYGDNGRPGGPGGNGGNGGFNGTGGNGGTGGTPGGNSSWGDGRIGGTGGQGIFGGTGGNGGTGGQSTDSDRGKGGNGGLGIYGGIGGTGGQGGVYMMAGIGGTGGDGIYGGIGGTGGQGGDGHSSYPSQIVGNGGSGGTGFCGGSGGNGGKGTFSSGTIGYTGGAGGNGSYGGTGGNGTDAITTNGVNGADIVGSVTNFPDFTTVNTPISNNNDMRGAHIFIVANTIDNPNIAAISTGGPGGIASSATPAGFPGWAFIYCNNVTNENTSGVVVE